MIRAPLVRKPQPARPSAPILRRKCARCGTPEKPGGRCPGCERKIALQRRLAIGAANDSAEREADRAAEQALGGGGGAAMAARPPILHRSAAAGEGAGEAPASVHQVLARPGRPLEATVRRDMEGRFGQDFSKVRVHDGAEAGQSARDVDASAYTVGSSIAFAPGRYAPGSGEGRKLLAHELAHVVQQGGGGAQLQRQKEDGKLESAPPKPKTGGTVVQGNPLSANEVERIDEAAKSVPARFRRFVAYMDVIKVGGSLAWRANNPGNLRASDLEIGKVSGASGSFSVFPDMATGRAAQRALYLKIYGKSTVRAAIYKLTPPSENDTEGYLKQLAAAGIDLDKTVSSQIDTLMSAIEANEGMIVGVEVDRDRPPRDERPGLEIERLEH